MSIIAYVGLPGSGKSYDVVANQILPGLKAGRRVVTNIPLNRDEVRRVTPKGEIVELPLDLIAQQPEVIDEYAAPGSLLIIDECWRLWPTGLKADKVPQAFKSLLAEHRHRVDAKGNATQIVFVCQDLAQLAAFARQLVEQTFHHTKLSHVGMRGSYRIDVFHGAVTGAVPPVQNRLRESFGRYEKKIFKLYKSHTMSEASKGGGANEVPLDARGNALKRPMAIAGMVLVFAAAGWGAHRVHGIVTGGGLSGKAEPARLPDRPPLEEVTANGAGPVRRHANASGVPAVRPPAPPRYRVVGYAERASGGGYAYIQLEDGRLDMIELDDCFEAVQGTGKDCLYNGWVVSWAGVRERAIVGPRVR